MKKLLVGLVTSFLLVIPAKASAASSGIVISEVQTESTASASDEFITIANTSNKSIDLTGWHIQYFSAGITNFSSPTRNIALSTVILPGGTVTVASTGYKTTEASVFFGATLAAVGGHVRITSGSGTTELEHDRFGWGTAATPETVAAEVVPKGSMYVRQKLNDNFVDTNNNKNDFAIPQEDTSGAPTDQPGVAGPAQLPAVLITELLPDPASPATDANDEFIELYNDSDSAIVLTGYKLQSGSTYSYSYTFKDEVLAPRAYMVLYSAKTKLALSNTAGGARLVMADGTVIDEVPKYSKAPTGASWQLQDTATWDWSSKPSPNTSNIISTTDASGSLTPNTTAKKTTTPKAAAKPKTTAVKAATTKKSTTTANTNSTYTAPSSDKKSLPVNPLVLAAVGIVAVGYMLYEYRHDIANKIRRLKNYKSFS